MKTQATAKTANPTELVRNMPRTPAPADFLAMGQALIGSQPSLMDLIDRCAKSMQEQSKRK